MLPDLNNALIIRVAGIEKLKCGSFRIIVSLQLYPCPRDKPSLLNPSIMFVHVGSSDVSCVYRAFGIIGIEHLKSIWRPWRIF